METVQSGDWGKDCATHLISTVYLRGGPSCVLHIVLLHLGTDFGAGGDVTCRLKRGGYRREGKWENKHRIWRENSFFQNWRTGNKSVNEANMWPLSPVYRTNSLSGRKRERKRKRVREKERESSSWLCDMAEIVYGEENECGSFSAPCVNCHLTSDFSNIIDSPRWKDLVYVL